MPIKFLKIITCARAEQIACFINIGRVLIGREDLNRMKDVGANSKKI